MAKPYEVVERFEAEGTTVADEAIDLILADRFIKASVIADILDVSTRVVIRHCANSGWAQRNGFKSKWQLATDSEIEDLMADMLNEYAVANELGVTVTFVRDRLESMGYVKSWQK